VIVAEEKVRSIFHHEDTRGTTVSFCRLLPSSSFLLIESLPVDFSILRVFAVTLLR